MEKSHIARYAVYSAPYFISVSALYLFGFWSNFHVNILEYIHLTEIVGLAVYQVAYQTVFLAIGVIASEIFIKPRYPYGGGVDTRTGRFLRKYSKLWLLILFAIILYLVLVDTNSSRWLIVAMLIALPTSIALTELGLLDDVISDNGRRNNFLYLLVLLPAMSFAWGNIEGDRVKKGAIKYAIDVKQSDLPFLAMSNEPIGYIGHAGEYFFLYGQISKNLHIIKSATFITLNPVSDAARQNGKSQKDVADGGGEPLKARKDADVPKAGEDASKRRSGNSISK